MSKWKCEICGLKFENFHAQGFNHKIYCPLCYYKKLYEINTKEIERLNNIINELEKCLIDKCKYIDENNPLANDKSYITYRTEQKLAYQYILDKLKELKDSDK